MRLMAGIKQRVNLAKSIELLEHRTKKVRSDESWVKKMAEEADLMLEDNIPSDDDGSVAYDQAQLINDLRNKRKELSQLLLRPLKRSLM